MSEETKQQALDSMLDATITAALERRPQVAMPADFAARVAAALPPATVAKPRPAIARNTALGAAALLLIALFVIAPHALPGAVNMAFAIELLLLAQLIAIAYFLARPISQG